MHTGALRWLCHRVRGTDTHLIKGVDEAHYLGRGSRWHGPQPHRLERVGNLSVVGNGL